uniref:hypothetical protein n=1 Tax=Neisseria sicca TaxID=490 RepID=UPI001C9A0E69
MGEKEEEELGGNVAEVRVEIESNRFDGGGEGKVKDGLVEGVGELVLRGEGMWVVGGGLFGELGVKGIFEEGLGVLLDLVGWSFQ